MLDFTTYEKDLAAEAVIFFDIGESEFFERGTSSPFFKHLPAIPRFLPQDIT